MRFRARFFSYYMYPMCIIKSIPFITHAHTHRPSVIVIVMRSHNMWYTCGAVAASASAGTTAGRRASACRRLRMYFSGGGVDSESRERAHSNRYHLANYRRRAVGGGRSRAEPPDQTAPWFFSILFYNNIVNSRSKLDSADGISPLPGCHATRDARLMNRAGILCGRKQTEREENNGRLSHFTQIVREIEFLCSTGVHFILCSIFGRKTQKFNSDYILGSKNF